MRYPIPMIIAHAEPLSFPIALEDESPAVYADRVGQWYANTATSEHKKQRGQYLTPVAAARFMASWCQAAEWSVRVLDPGAGAGVLACALCEALAARTDKPVQIELDAYETDPRLLGYLQLCLRHAENWLRRRGIAFKFRVNANDFILHHAAAPTNDRGLFSDDKPLLPTYDVVISNPPYFKIAASDPRAQVLAAVVHGQPNIYALFMTMAAHLLKPGGELIFITPRSYTSGPYFRLFRQRFFEMMTPAALHVFGSRRDAFERDEVLQENIILRAIKCRMADSRLRETRVIISSSAGVSDLDNCIKREVKVGDVLDVSSSDKVLHVPVIDTDERIAGAVQSWTGSLAAYGIAISTGPVVPFRAVPLLSASGCVPETHAPLLWMQHVQAMQTYWPLARTSKNQYIVADATAASLLVPNKNYILLRRFSSKEQKRRLIAAPYLSRSQNTPLLGLENHLNYIYRPNGELTEEETTGLAGLLNSRLLDTYFRIFNGSTQVSATELRAMPLPPLEAITRIGKRLSNCACTLEEVDAAVESTLCLNALFSSTENTPHGDD
jgi:adenine-specific DNA-methyltransferase